MLSEVKTKPGAIGSSVSQLMYTQLLKPDTFARFICVEKADRNVTYNDDFLLQIMCTLCI